MLKLKLQYFGHLMQSQHTRKDPDAVTKRYTLERGLADRCSIATNRPGWRKGKFALFQMLATVTGLGAGWGVADICPKVDSLPSKQRVRAFIGIAEGGERLHAETA